MSLNTTSTSIQEAHLVVEVISCLSNPCFSLPLHRLLSALRIIKESGREDKLLSHLDCLCARNQGCAWCVKHGAPEVSPTPPVPAAAPAAPGQTVTAVGFSLQPFSGLGRHSQDNCRLQRWGLTSVFYISQRLFQQRKLCQWWTCTLRRSWLLWCGLLFFLRTSATRSVAGAAAAASHHISSQNKRDAHRVRFRISHTLTWYYYISVHHKSVCLSAEVTWTWPTWMWIESEFWLPR